MIPHLMPCIQKHLDGLTDIMRIKILCMGCKDMEIATSSDGNFVADKEQRSHMKTDVEQMDAEVMYAEKSWGTYNVICFCLCRISP